MTSPKSQHNGGANGRFHSDMDASIERRARIIGQVLSRDLSGATVEGQNTKRREGSQDFS